MAMWPGMGFPGQTPPFVPGPLGGGPPMPMPGQGPLAGPQPAVPMAGGKGPAWLQKFAGRLQGAAANPMFQMGMGLLGAAQDSRINAPQAAVQGLLTANQVQQQQAAAEQERQRMGILAAQEERAKAEAERQQAERERVQRVGTKIRGILAEPEQIKGVPEGVRQSIGLLAEVDPEAAVDALSRYRMTQEGRLGTYNPRDYTAESWAKYLETGNAADLERWNPFKVVETAQGRVLMNTSQDASDPFVMQIDTTAEQAEAARLMEFQKTLGTQEANNLIDAAAQAGNMQQIGAQVESLLSNPKFPAAVGALEVRGRLGRFTGSESGMLREHAMRLSNALTSSKVADWKGAISEKELAFFKQSVPQATSSDETWRYWYENEFKPFQQYVNAKAAGGYQGPDWITQRGGAGAGDARATVSDVQYEDPELMEILSKYPPSGATSGGF